ncbi:MAG: HEPN domain-containing protein [Flavobacteriaceae bacterium]|jgi:HEPN domain-containing protein|nr:HEPN domain-containing protein [Flavobacteriaceae bacterium]
MTKEEKVEYWMDLSDYDMESADAMFETKRYLYVGFMCHQAIEKIFKAYYSKLKEDAPPYIHKLVRIAELAGFYDEFSEAQKKFIDTIEPLNIKARYPDYKANLLKQLSPQICQTLIRETKILQQWIKEKLS